jgi:hypothetical protein
MPKVHKNTGSSTYTIVYVHNSQKEKHCYHNDWVARNSYNAEQSFLKAHPNTTVISIERQTVSHLV